MKQNHQNHWLTKITSVVVISTFLFSNSVTYSDIQTTFSFSGKNTSSVRELRIKLTRFLEDLTDPLQPYLDHKVAAVSVFPDAVSFRDRTTASARSELRSADPSKIEIAEIKKTSGKGATEVVDISQYEGEVGSGKIINPRSKQLIAELFTKYSSSYTKLMRQRSERLAAIQRGEIIPGGKGDVEPDMIIEDAYGNQATVRDILTTDWQIDKVPEPLTRAGAILTGPWTPKMGISALSGRVITKTDRRLYNEVLDGLKTKLPANLVTAIEKVDLRKPDGKLAATDEKIAYVQAKLANVQTELTTTNKVVPVRVFADLQDAKVVHGDGPFEGPQTISNIVNGNQPDVLRQRDGKVYSVPPKGERPVITIRINDFDVSDRHMTYDGKAIPDVITSLVFAVETIYDALKNDSNQAFALVIPKLETPEEYAFVTRMIVDLQKELGIKKNISTIFMNETNESAIKLSLMLWVARHHVKITNVGRWDKGAADMRIFWFWLRKVYGDLGKVDMFKTLMDFYVRDNLVIAQKHGLLPEGGMVTVMPSEGNAYPDDDRNAIQAIVVDKVYEWLLGYDFAWVASPSYLPLVQTIFQQPREFEPVLKDLDYKDARKKLLAFPKVPLSRNGLYADVYEALTYQFGYRNTGAAVAIDSLTNHTRGMFDGATGKKVNYHLWMLIKAQAILTGTETVVTEALLDEMIAQVMADKGDRYRQFVPDSELEIAKILVKALFSSKHLVLWEKELMNLVVDERDPAVVQQKVNEWIAKYNVEQDNIFSGAPRSELRAEKNSGTEAFKKKVRTMTRWMANSRFSDTLRLYSPRQVAEQQGTILQDYPVARVAAIGFYDYLRHDMFANGKAIITYGAYTPGDAVQQRKKGIRANYGGGWATSAKGSVTEDPGSDLASYPLSQVPEDMAPIVRALLAADRNQRFARMRMTAAERAATPEIDFSPWIIADADTGHGGDAHVRNVIRRFVEVGVPGYHIEDQKPGCKKCGHQGGKVLVSQNEQNKRLNAARFQLDVMKVPGIIVARTDAEAASFIDDDSDERDQPFIYGATNPDVSSYKLVTLAVLKRFYDKGIKEINGHLLYAVSDRAYEKTNAWLKNQGLLKTVDQIIKSVNKKNIAGVESEKALNQATEAIYTVWQKSAAVKTYREAVSDELQKRLDEGESLPITIAAWNVFAKKASLDDARTKAEELGISVMWDPQLVRTPEGFFQIQSGIDYAIARALAAAPFADLLWMETKTANLADAKKFADAIHAVYPNQLLAYNLSPSFNWDTTGMTDDEMRRFPEELGKLGFVFNFITYGGHQIDGLAAEEFSEALMKDGPLALARVQRRLRLLKSPYVKPQTLVGGPRLDAALSASSGRTAATKAMGKGSTEVQHTVETELPVSTLAKWLNIWADVNHFEEDPLQVELDRTVPGQEELVLNVFDKNENKIADIIFRVDTGREGKKLLFIKDQNTEPVWRQRRLTTLMHLFLIKRYEADAIHYLSPTEANQNFAKSVVGLGVFDKTADDPDGNVMTAHVNRKEVERITVDDGRLKQFIEKAPKSGTGESTQRSELRIAKLEIQTQTDNSLRIVTPEAEADHGRFRAAVESAQALFASNPEAFKVLIHILGIPPVSKLGHAGLGLSHAVAFENGLLVAAGALAKAGNVVGVVATTRSELRLVNEVNETLRFQNQIITAPDEVALARALELRGVSDTTYLTTNQLTRTLLLQFYSDVVILTQQAMQQLKTGIQGLGDILQQSITAWRAIATKA